MDINTQLTPDLFVGTTQDVFNESKAISVRFTLTYKGLDYLADFSADDQSSDTSIIEQVGPQQFFNELNTALRTTHRDQFQIWLTEHYGTR